MKNVNYAVYKTEDYPQGGQDITLPSYFFTLQLKSTPWVLDNLLMITGLVFFLMAGLLRMYYLLINLFDFWCQLAPTDSGQLTK